MHPYLILISLTSFPFLEQGVLEDPVQAGVARGVLGIIVMVFTWMSCMAIERGICGRALRFVFLVVEFGLIIATLASFITAIRQHASTAVTALTGQVLLLLIVDLGSIIFLLPCFEVVDGSYVVLKRKQKPTQHDLGP